jgi:hypothetical protein
LEVHLAGAPSAQLPWTSSFVDITTTAFTPACADGTTNSTTAVTVVAAPAASTQRQLKFFSITNQANASVTLTIQLNNNGTARIIFKGSLAVGDNLQYCDGQGFSQRNATGAMLGTSTAAAHQATHLPGASDAITTAAAVANPPNTSNAEGSAASLARSDHTHALAAFGTGATNFCVGNDSRLSDDRVASALRSATTSVVVSAATAPTAGQVLTASSSTAASWADAGGGGDPGGSTTQVQYNNAGAFDGAAKLVIDANTCATLVDYTTTDPAAPSAGTSLYSKLRANRAAPAFRSASTGPVDIGVAEYGKRILAPAITTAGTAGTLATTNLLTSSYRTNWGGTANTTYGARSPLACWSGNAAGLGGFFACLKFGIQEYVSGCRLIAGLADSASTTLLNGDPSALSNFFGIAKDAGDSYLQLMHNDAAGTCTKTDLGVNYSCAANNVYELRIFCASNTSVFYYSLQRLDSAQFTEGSVSTNVPAATAFLSLQLGMSPVATTGNTTVCLLNSYLEF